MMASVKNRLASLRQAYAPHEHRPLEGYLMAMGTYGAVAGALAAAVKVTGAPVPERPATSDVVLISIATHKLSRLLTKEAVTSPLRAPFTRYEKPAGSAELVEQVRSDGNPLKHSVGELLSCPFCLAVWISTGLTGGLVLAPRLTRLVSTAMTAVAVSDFLQMGYTIAKEAAEGPKDDADGDDDRTSPDGQRATVPA